MTGHSDICITKSGEDYPLGSTSRHLGAGCVDRMGFSGGKDEQSRPSKVLVEMGLSARFGPMKAVDYPYHL